MSTEKLALPASFEQVLAHLVLADDAIASLMVLSDHAALLSIKDGSHAAVFRYGNGYDAELAEQLKRAVAGLRRGQLTLLVVGGGVPVQRIMARAQPFWMIGRQVSLLQLMGGGELWRGSHTPGRSPLVRALRLPPNARAGLPPAELRPLLQGAVNPAPEVNRELVAFADRLRKVRPWATLALAALCGVLFLLEETWGSSELRPTLVRMGGNMADRVMAGDWYRLGSSIFLHGGPTHLFFNVLVLLYLGGFMERLLGARRFLVLFFLSGLAGSAASAFLSQASLSVGSSGALWGFLGGSAALALRPRGLLPQPVVSNLKRATLINLLLNLGVSFLPQVDIFAHLGGGVMGAILVGSGALTVGLKGLRDPGLPEGVGSPKVARTPVWMTVLATLVTVAVLGGTVWAQKAGKPWELLGPWSWHRVMLGTTGISVELPAHLGQPVEKQQDGKSVFIAGDKERDVLMIVIVAWPLPPDYDATMAAELLEEIRAVSKAQVIEGWTCTGEARLRDLKNLKVVESVFDSQDDRRLWEYQLLRSRFRLQVDIMAWKRLVGSSVLRPEGVIESIQGD